MQLGAALSGLGGAVAVAYWVYTLEADGQQSFWSPPGIAGIAVTAIGLIALVVGFIVQGDASQTSQKQKGGKNSRNYQAGRDMKIGQGGDGIS